jgi:hydrogenase expression/formation protein HypE
MSSEHDGARILLAHGGGGRLMRQLVRDELVARLGNDFLNDMGDSAVLPVLGEGRPALTTDAFVVDPPVFPGGDVGYLSVCGTVNDLAVAGATPRWLTWAVVLEEGVELELVRQCAAGAARAAAEAGVQVVAGDTKVVPRGKGDRLYAVTAGVGVVPFAREWNDARVVPGDKVIVSGPLGDHGATVMACRHRLESEQLASDCAPLAGLLATLGEEPGMHAAHDPTRGGLLATCHEVAERASVRITLVEADVPVRREVRAVCDLLGLDPLAMACEGRAVLLVDPDRAEVVLAALRGHPLGREAAVVGAVEPAVPGRAPVVLETAVGGRRPLDLLSGLDLPRIC